MKEGKRPQEREKKNPSDLSALTRGTQYAAAAAALVVAAAALFSYARKGFYVVGLHEKKSFPLSLRVVTALHFS